MRLPCTRKHVTAWQVGSIWVACDFSDIQICSGGHCNWYYLSSVWLHFQMLQKHLISMLCMCLKGIWFACAKK